MMCVRFIHMHGGLIHLHTCIERLERLVEPGVRVSWGVMLLQSWIYEYFLSLRCRASPLPRAESEPLAGRWDGARIAQCTALEGQNRLEMFREQLDRLTHTHVEWLPYRQKHVELAKNMLKHAEYG
ncbi:hypothetical protein LINGRAHAP2_LOCUS4270 [Linum grandiflorum]